MITIAIVQIQPDSLKIFEYQKVHFMIIEVLIEDFILFLTYDPDL